MALDVLQQKKEEVVKSMLKDFENELNVFQSTVLSLFEKKITQTILSDVELGDSLEEVKPRLNFFEKLLIQISPSAAEKVFLFIKEKQEQLVKANTVEELEALKKGIVLPTKPTTQEQAAQTSKENQAPNSEEKIKKEEEKKEGDKKMKNIIVGGATGAGLGISAKAIGQIDKLKTAKKLEQTATIENPKLFLKRFEELAEGLRKESLNPKLTNHQKKLLDKSIKEFQSISKNVDADTFSAVKMLEKLDKKLTNSLLKSISPGDGKKLADLISNEPNFATKLMDDAVPIEDIQKIIKSKGISSVSEDVLKGLRTMKSAEELQGAVHIMTKLQGLKALRRGMRGVILLDLIFTGFDIWILNEGLDDAEVSAKINQLRSSTAKEHARVQFGASIALTAMSIIVTCSAVGSAGGPIGTAVGAILGVASFAVSQAIDIFYDAVEYYQQNQEDFKRQYRTEIKQAIIQSAASEEWKLNMYSRDYASAKKAGTSWAQYYLIPFGIGAFTAKREKLTTTTDAWMSLIWQEEYQKPEYSLIADGHASGKTEEEYIKTLPADQQQKFQEQRKLLNQVVSKRFEYIKNFTYEKKGTPQYSSFVSAVKNNLGIKAIEKILTESEIYSRMGQTGADKYVTGAKTPAEYKKLFAEKLKTESPNGFATLEKMWATQPQMVVELHQEIINTESMFRNSWASPDYDKKDKAATMQKNLEFVKKYYEYKTLDLPIEEQQRLDIPFRAIDAVMIEAILISGDFTALGASPWTKDQVKNYFTQDLSKERRDTQIESSDSVGQNIIYRMAREFHGYQGHNTMPDLIDFFREDKRGSLGLYYSDGRIINNDNAIDKRITTEELKKMDSMSAEEIMKMWTKPSLRNEIFAHTIDPIEIAKGSIPGGVFLPGSVFGFSDNAARLDTSADAGSMDKKMNIEYRNRLKTIIYQEKAFTTPTVQKMVETNIITYIKKNSQPVSAIHKDGTIDVNTPKAQGYIEMPYYLIIQAKKAKIGNIEKFLFKYENNQIFACTSQVYRNEILNFAQTKTPIQKEIVAFGTKVEHKQALPYISYVDQAKNKFEGLITFDKDELDLPAEYVKKYQDKIKERNTFKLSLVSMQPDIAKARLLERYQKDHDWFEHMYTAMLMKISKFSRGNDLDDAQYLQQTEARAAALDTITIKNGIIQGSPEMFSENQKKIFYRILAERKPRGKDILKMASSKTPEEADKAIRAVKQIVKSMMEAQVVHFDEQGNITSIVHGVSKGFESKLLNVDPATQEKIKKAVLARIAINGNVSNYFTPTAIDIAPIDESKIVIIPTK